VELHHALAREVRREERARVPSAPIRLRIRKSPDSKRLCSASISMPRKSEPWNRRCSAGLAAAKIRPSTSIGGLPSSSKSTFSRAPVTNSGNTAGSLRHHRPRHVAGEPRPPPARA
jgi:hypothetical protein